ncbi:MAG TPA: hypothetical protein VNE83_02460 [Terriglobales bacterium]|nr:hypothetical protein [Terriglobales bacterium]
MIPFLASLSPSGIMMLLLGFMVCGPMLELMLRRRLLQRWFKSSDSVVNYVQILTVFYGLLLGLVAIDLWQKQEAAELNAVTESNQVRILDGLAQYFPSGAEVIDVALGDYMQEVVKKEWPRMVASEAGMLFSTSPELDLVRATILDVPVATPGQQSIFAQMLASYNAIVAARQRRLLDSERRLPAVLWIVLLLGAVFIWLATWFIPAPHLRSQLLLSSITSGYLFLLVYLVVVLDHPFIGAWRVDASTYQHVLQTFH